MADVFSRQKRSDIMSRVRSGGNQATEVALAQLLRRNGIVGWRRNTAVYGKPDFVFGKPRVAVFVDGCFWHGCPLHATKPASNITFWDEKLSRNRIRDRLVTTALEHRGWTVLRIWQHELLRREEHRLVTRIQRILASALHTANERRTLVKRNRS